MSYAQYPGATFFGVRKNGIFDTVVASNLITSNLEQAPAPPLSITCYTVVGALNSTGDVILYYDTACTQPVTIPGNLLLRSTSISSGSSFSASGSTDFYLFNSTSLTAPGSNISTYLQNNGSNIGANGSPAFTDPNSLAVYAPTNSGQYLGIENDSSGSGGTGQYTVIATFY